MHTQALCQNKRNLTAKPAAGGASCKRRSTVVTTTLCSLVLVLGVACGGSNKGNARYEGAVDKQEKCCESLGAGGKRDACLQRIVRIERSTVQPTAAEICADRTGDARTKCEADLLASVRGSKVNRATYACVQRHFVCDGTTGTATQASAQAQLDCINDL